MPALDLTKIMVEKGVEVEVISSLVMYMVRDLLVNHGNWKYQHPHQRWQITTQVLYMENDVYYVPYLLACEAHNHNDISSEIFFSCD